MEKSTYTYETKCRKCGSFKEWFFSQSSDFSWQQFANAMQDYIEHPRMHECDNCNKKTVQDVVLYTPLY